MPSLNRTIKTSLWQQQKYFSKLSYEQKYLYLYLLTCPFSSETSVFSFEIEYQLVPTHLDYEQFIAIFNSLIDRGLIIYDQIYEEVLIVNYFENHAPNGGLTYEMFRNDFREIKSEMLIDHLVEISKKHPISKAFYAALADRRPELESETQMSEYQFSDKNDKSLDAIRGYAKSGRENR